MHTKQVLWQNLVYDSVAQYPCCRTCSHVCKPVASMPVRSSKQNWARPPALKAWTPAIPAPLASINSFDINSVVLLAMRMRNAIVC